MNIDFLKKEVVLVAFVLFFVFFPINFTFLPSFLSTRSIVAFLGVIVFFLKYKIWYNYVYISWLKPLFVVLALMSLWSLLCTSVFNLEYDFSYVNYPISIAIMFFALFQVYYMMIVLKLDRSFKKISEVIFVTIFLQILITTASFFNGTLSTLLLSIQRLDERTTNISFYHLENASRFLGFGVMFYTAGIFAGFGLILGSILLTKYTYNRNSKFFLLLAYLMIFLVGMGMSRTTMIGFLLSLFVFIGYLWNNKHVVVRYGIPFLTISILSGLGIVMIISTFSKTYGDLFSFAFEVFTGFFESGTVSSSSSTETINSFSLPNYERTYFFGTGINEMYQSKGDYRYSDVGYSRLLYYSGFLGVFLYFYLEFKVLQYAFRFNKQALILLFIYLCILNIKGISTLIILCLLYCFIPNRHYKVL